MHLCEFYQRIPMYIAQLVEVKGNINLESCQVFGGGMGAPFGFSQTGANAPFGQPSFGGGMNMGFGFPSAPSPMPTPSFSVSFVFRK